MPNWCSNTLTLVGDKTERDRFVAAVTEPDREAGMDTYSILKNLVPMPEALEGTTSPTPASPEPHPNWKVMLDNGEMTPEWYAELCQSAIDSYNRGQAAREATGFPNWYEWQYATWGTKWGDCETYLNNHDDNETEFRYETPWGPADNGILNISKAFPTLTLVTSYVGEGNEFIGVVAMRDGEVIAEEGMNYTEMPDFSTMYEEEKYDEVDETVFRLVDEMTNKVFEFLTADL